MVPYRFSPIQSKDKLLEAIKYVTTQVTLLAEKCVGVSLVTESLTIFSHDPQEFARLCEMANDLGEPYNENNGPRVKLKEAIAVGASTVRFVRIRKPDPDRPQVGCADFNVGDYFDFKTRFLAYIASHVIKRPEYEMIEFSDPDFDVLAYAVSPVLSPS